jgi:hypothetical protein
MNFDTLAKLLPNLASRPPRLRWFQFSLRTLLVGVTLFSTLCAIGTCIGWSFVWDCLLTPLCSIGACIGWCVPSGILVVVVVGGVIAKTRSVELVRLLGAVAISLAASGFVTLFDCYAAIRFPFDHSGQTSQAVPDIALFVTVHRLHAYAIPALGLLLGSLILWRRPRSKVLIELVVQSLWILAFTWAGLVLVVWQIRNIPLFSAMHWHY